MNERERKKSPRESKVRRNKSYIMKKKKETLSCEGTKRKRENKIEKKQMEDKRKKIPRKLREMFTLKTRA